MNFLVHASWQEALLFLLCIVFLGGCACVAIGVWHRNNYRRVPRRLVDPAYRHGQFYVPPPIRDGRGLRS